MASSVGDGPTSTQPAPSSGPDQRGPDLQAHSLQPNSSGICIQNTPVTENIVTPNLERLLASCSEKEVIGGPGGSTSSYLDQCQDILAAWTFVNKDAKSKVIQMCQTASQPNQPTEYQDLHAKIKQLLRHHQKHVIDDRWTEAPGHLKTHLFNAITSAEPLLCPPTTPATAEKKPVVAGELAKELTYLKSIHANAWSGQVLRAILTANTDFKSAEYFQLEGPDLCLKRLAVLVGTKLYLPAFNLAKYCVSKSGLDGSSTSGTKAGPSWMMANTESRNTLRQLIDIYIGLLFKIKRDTLLYLPFLKNFPTTDVLDIIARFQDRASKPTDEKDAFHVLWSNPEGKKVSGATAAANSAIDFLMVVAAKHPLPEPLLAKVVGQWTQKLTIDEADFAANLEIELEKYSSLEGISNHLYEIGVHVYRKYGRRAQQVVLDTMLRGFHLDLNRREVAIHKQDLGILKGVEENVSLGMQKLALIFDQHLAARRECVLTAFSLTPTPALMQEIESLARESGFVEDGCMSKGQGDEANSSDQPEWSRIKKQDFESACQDFTASLETKKYSRAYCGPIKERQVRNLDALLAIEGNLITEAANYNPVSTPFPSFCSAAMGGHLSERTLGDVLTCISCPRWHLLSWVLDWPTLSDRCSALLKDPEIRIPGGIKKELKYLVIDYTQFEEWSSDEEIIASSGIEKGYEDWEDEDYIEPSHVKERGLGDDEEFDFNVIPKLVEEGEEEGQDLLDQVEKMEEDEEEDSDLYIYPEDYLPTTQKTKSEENVVMVNYALMPSEGWLQGPLVKDYLRTVVPGLDGDTSFLTCSSVDLECRVVQVGNKKTTTSPAKTTTVATTSSPSLSPSTAPSAIVTSAPAVVTVQATTSSNVTSQIVQAAATPQQIVLPAKDSVGACPQPQPQKVQYVYKQGGQTIVIDAPRQATTATGALPQTVRLVLPPPQPKPSVDSIANTLISQIQTPLTPNASGTLVRAVPQQLQQIRAQPQVQHVTARVVGTASTAGAAGGGAAASSTTTTGQFIQVQPQQTLTPQRCIIQGPTLTRLPATTVASPVAAAAAASGAATAVSDHQPKISTIIQQKLATATPVQQVQQQQSTDLIRQLNLARAQGLVVLQQWGDKQVLVHKATGRWIMRQGNRLVTVPPQALGITASANGDSSTEGADTDTDTAGPAATAGSSSTIDKANSASSSSSSSQQLSTNVEEQLAEFDSILESKFTQNSNTAPPPAAETINSIINISSNNSPNSTEVAAPSTATTSISLPASPASRQLIFNNSSIKPIQQHQQAQKAQQMSSSTTAVASTSSNNDNPDTMKRIQQILDDYNQQIRNSPDLQTKPAPRRRIPAPQGATTPTGMSPIKSVNMKNNNGKGEAGEVAKEELQTPLQGPVRQIVMPSGLAAQLAASGRQIVVVTGPGGQKMVALKPIATTASLGGGGASTSEVSTLSLKGPVATPHVTEGGGVAAAPAPSSSNTSPQSAASPAAAPPASSPMQTVNLSVVSKSDDDDGVGMGSPLGSMAMEMTPGQMMEAEMSASGILDDVMMGGPVGGDPEGDLLMSGLGDEPFFPGFATSASSTAVASSSAPSGALSGVNKQSFLNFYDDEDEPEGEEVDQTGFFPTSSLVSTLAGPSASSGTDDDDTSSPGSASQSDTSSGTVVNVSRRPDVVVPPAAAAPAVQQMNKGKKRTAVASTSSSPAKRARKPTVKIIEAAQRQHQLMPAVGAAAAAAAARKSNVSKNLIRGSLGSESTCSSSSEGSLAVHVGASVASQK